MSGTAKQRPDTGTPARPVRLPGLPAHEPSRPATRRPGQDRLRALLSLAPLVALVVLLSACASRSVEPYERPAPAYAMPAATEGAFAGIESGIRSRHGPEHSGFALIDANADAVRHWLLLIDSATHSIDVQYYLWYGDTVGQLLVNRLLDAADRGVRVRMLVDDLNSLIRDATTVVSRDDVAARLDAHPNVELRLFNPWTNRDIAGRAGEMVVEFGRLNQRMHNKAIIVDNRAVILGGRNIGNEYFGLNPAFNFRDLDVLGIGPVARQTSAVFDAYWNSAWAMPAAALGLQVPAEQQAVARSQARASLAQASALAQVPLEPRSWGDELRALPGRLHPGTSRVIADLPTGGGIDQLMLDEIRALLRSARKELLIVNAYIIPAEHGIAILRDLDAAGVDVRILTNSLASHDVPAVNSHYSQWRRPILEAGGELHEMRHDAAIKESVADTPPTQAHFMGLHAKALVIDRERAYIGSMNLDPRSALINSEMGVIIDSPGLGEALAEIIERDMQPANSWRVELDGDRGLRWINDAETVTRQPARSWWQRVEDVLFKAVPKEYY
jgi:putative cardiolipin synthase